MLIARRRFPYSSGSGNFQSEEPAAGWWPCLAPGINLLARQIPVRPTLSFSGMRGNRGAD